MSMILRRSRIGYAWMAWIAVELVAGRLAAADDLKAYRAARIFTAAGESVEAGLLVVRGKLVESVLKASEAPPAGAEMIDLGVAVVMPGFVNPLTSISERSYKDSNAAGITSQHAGAPRDARGFVAISAVKPEESVYRRLGRSGYAAFGWLPDASGFIAGQVSVLRPRAGKEKDAAALSIKDSAYLLVSFEMGKRWRDAAEGELRKAADVIVKENEAKKKAEEQPAAKDTEKKDTEKKDTEKKDAPPPQPAAPAPQQPPKPPPPPDPLVRALKGEIPLFVRVRGPAALDHFFRIIDALPAKPPFVLVTPPLPPEAIEKLDTRKDRIHGVVLEPRMETLPEMSVLVSAARLFAERGFPVALVPLSDSLEGHEKIPLYLAEMLKSGMPPKDVLAAVTSVPARMLGLEGKVGALAKGAFASFCVYNEDPLSGNARLLKAFVEGAEVFSDDPVSGKIAGEAVR